LSEPAKNEAALGGSIGISGIERQRHRKVLQRPIKQRSFQKDPPSIVVCPGRSGRVTVKTGSPIEFSQCLVIKPKLSILDAEIVVRIGVIGIERNCFPQGVDREIYMPEAAVYKAQVVIPAGPLGALVDDVLP